ncbi:hypothetical protein [Pseudaminobacter sp. NGMCC 1.201702]|uniref:hypothetical protein n=1 Tax=Pseudaminobacter sp. NGMCC 1.201702 TaxID=3391825 RepID=UPI0039EF81A8
MPTDEEQAERGAKRLMLRLPALRRQIEVLVSNGEICALCTAFEDATTTLDRLRKEKASTVIIRDYEQICAEIECEVVALCKEAFDRQ